MYRLSEIALKDLGILKKYGFKSQDFYNFADHFSLLLAPRDKVYVPDRGDSRTRIGINTNRYFPEHKVYITVSDINSKPENMRKVFLVLCSMIENGLMYHPSAFIEKEDVVINRETSKRYFVYKLFGDRNYDFLRCFECETMKERFFRDYEVELYGKDNLFK